MAIDLEKKSLLHNVWELAWPATLSQMLGSALTIVDMIWIGRLGSPAIAAVALCGTIVWILFIITELIGAGTLALVSRFTGAGEDEQAREVAFHSLLFGLVGSVFVGVVGYIFSQQFIAFFGASEEVIWRGSDYLRVMMLGYPFIMLAVIINQMLSAAGDTRTPLIFFAVGNVLNIIINPFLIFGIGPFPRLETAGSAMATIISMLCSTMLGLWFISRKRSIIRPFARSWRKPISLSWLPRLLKIGVPAFGQQIQRPITGLLLFRMVSAFGTQALAAFGIGLRSLSFSYTFLSGIWVATSTLVGQFLGRDEPEMAERSANTNLMLAGGLRFIMFFAYFFGGFLIIRIFSTDLLVLEYGVDYLRAVAVGWILGVFAGVYGAAFRGAGNNTPPMVAGIVANWAVKLPLAFICSGLILRVFTSLKGVALLSGIDFGLSGIWWAITASMLIEGIIMLFWFRAGRWKEKWI